MKPDRYAGLRVNEVGVDEQGRHVLVINCQCTLPHANVAIYTATHDHGCLMRASEGIVFEMDGDRVTGWGCQNIFDRVLTAVPADKAADILRQMGERLERDRRDRRHRRAAYFMPSLIPYLGDPRW